MMVNKLSKMPVISSRKLSCSVTSRNKPPAAGPIRLPTLNATPHNKFPVGSNSFGIKSVI